MLRINKDLWDERDIEWILCNPRFFYEGDKDIALEDDQPDDRQLTVVETFVKQRTSAAHCWQPP